MADEAFALSPISARASLPTDTDYDAICDAFMETSRGRWFLREYAKRNRNADTQMVLEAVARIEQTLSLQKQEAAVDPPAADPAADYLPAIQSALASARQDIAACFTADGGKAPLDLIKGGMDTIRNVAWALRERGVDLQICGIFDAQVSQMMEGYLQLSAQAGADSASAQVLAVFDALSAQIAAIIDPEAEPLAAQAEAVRPIPDAAMPTALAHDMDAAFNAAYGDAHDIEIVASAGDPSAADSAERVDESEDADFINAIAATAKELAQLEPAETSDSARLTPLEALEALARVASRGFGSRVDAAVERAQPAATDPASPPAAMPAPAPTPKLASTPAPAPANLTAGTSLGHAVLRSGLVRPDGAKPHPLAAFHRLSQAEKVAFAT